MQQILRFLTQLAQHNDRQWFADHKDEFRTAQNSFLQFSEQFLAGLTHMEPELRGIQSKDCIYRIYRDVRFSSNKSPYKTWFGMYVAPAGGRKSPRAGYYMHIQPGNCLFSAGIWCPNAPLLKALRKSIFDNYDEVETLFKAPEWSFFGDFDQDYMLTKTPTGYPRDWPHADWLRHKTYTYSHHFSDDEVCQPDYMQRMLACANAAKPMNDFLNFVFYNAE